MKLNVGNIITNRRHGVVCKVNRVDALEFSYEVVESQWKDTIGRVYDLSYTVLQSSINDGGVLVYDLEELILGE